MKGQSKSNFMPYENERMTAKPKATKKATPKKTLLPAPFKNEREMAQAMARAKAKKKATPTPKPKPKPTKGPTQRQMLDVPNMTPAQKLAYLKQQQKYAY